MKFHFLAVRRQDIMMTTSTGVTGFDQDKRSVTKQLNRLFDSHSDHIKQAKKSGAEYANSRDLLNNGNLAQE